MKSFLFLSIITIVTISTLLPIISSFQPSLLVSSHSRWNCRTATTTSSSTSTYNNNNNNNNNNVSIQLLVVAVAKGIKNTSSHSSTLIRNKQNDEDESAATTNTDTDISMSTSATTSISTETLRLDATLASCYSLCRFLIYDISTGIKDVPGWQMNDFIMLGGAFSSCIVLSALWSFIGYFTGIFLDDDDENGENYYNNHVKERNIVSTTSSFGSGNDRRNDRVLRLLGCIVGTALVVGPIWILLEFIFGWPPASGMILLGLDDLGGIASTTATATATAATTSTTATTLDMNTITTATTSSSSSSIVSTILTSGLSDASRVDLLSTIGTGTIGLTSIMCIGRFFTNADQR